MERIFTATKPVKDVRGLRNGNIPTTAPLMREAFDIPSTDFYLYEDFRHGISATEIDGTTGATTDPIRSAPWRLTVIDGNPDNAHFMLLNDTADFILSTNDSDNDECALQYAYEPLTGNGKWACEAKLKVNDADKVSMFFGWHNYKAAGTIAQTAALGGSVSGFHVSDGAAVKCSSDNGTLTQTTLSSTIGDGLSSGSLVDDTYTTLSLFHDNTTGTMFYVDGTLVATHTPSETDLGSTDASPTLAIAVHSTGQVDRVTVDYMAFYAEGVFPITPA